MFKRFLKIFALVYIYQLAKFGDLMRCMSKDIFKYRLSYTNTHHDIIILVNYGLVKNRKARISGERNIYFFLICASDNILRSYFLSGGKLWFWKFHKNVFFFSSLFALMISVTVAFLNELANSQDLNNKSALVWIVTHLIWLTNILSFFSSLLPTGSSFWFILSMQ